MLKRHGQFLKSLFLVFDVLIISLCWALAYFLCFQKPLITISNGICSVDKNLIFLFPVVGIYTATFVLRKLYAPRRTVPLFRELGDIFRASCISIAIVVLFLYLIDEYQYLGIFPVVFWGITLFAVFISRIILRKSLRILRRKGYNLRHILIVGTGKLAKEVGRRIRERREFGLEIIGFLSKNPQEVGDVIDDVKIIGHYKEIKNIVVEKNADQVIFALPQKEHRILMVLLGYISDTMADIRIIPDLRYNFFTLYHGVEDFDGFPVIRLRGSPLNEYNNVVKRGFDFCVSLAVLIMISPVMVVIAVLVKLESSGPIFYGQDRMGLDGKLFKMIKFRSMRENAELQSGPVWAKENDPRRTKLGKLLRRTSLDELPQLFNVLKGEMSLVGPRPERPVFIDKFRKNIPAYMLRHKIKSGITGWAQIHGLRGNTSLEKRIECDIYYIEEWSIWLDVKILIRTIPALLKGEGAY